MASAWKLATVPSQPTEDVTCAVSANLRRWGVMAGLLRGLPDAVAAAHALDLEGHSFHCLVLLRQPVAMGSGVSNTLGYMP